MLFTYCVVLLLCKHRCKIYNFLSNGKYLHFRPCEHWTDMLRICACVSVLCAELEKTLHLLYVRMCGFTIKNRTNRLNYSYSRIKRDTFVFWLWLCRCHTQYTHIRAGFYLLSPISYAKHTSVERLSLSLAKLLPRSSSGNEFLWKFVIASTNTHTLTAANTCY